MSPKPGDLYGPYKWPRWRVLYLCQRRPTLCESCIVLVDPVSEDVPKAWILEFDHGGWELWHRETFELTSMFTSDYMKYSQRSATFSAKSRWQLLMKGDIENLFPMDQIWSKRCVQEHWVIAAWIYCWLVLLINACNWRRAHALDYETWPNTTVECCRCRLLSYSPTFFNRAPGIADPEPLVEIRHWSLSQNAGRPCAKQNWSRYSTCMKRRIPLWHGSTLLSYSTGWQ